VALDKRFFNQLLSSVCSRRASFRKDQVMRLLDEFPFPVWRAGLDGKCDYFNKAWLDFTGRTLEQELGDGWASGVHPEDICACLRDYREAFRARAPFQLQYRLRRYDGEFHWVIDYGSPVNDDAGNFAGYIGACHGINERKQAEMELGVRARQQAVVAELGQHALKGNDLVVLMNEAVALVAQTLAVEYCKVLELLPDGSALLLRAGVGWKDGYVGHGTVGAGIDSQAGYTLLCDEPVIVEDLRAETRFNGPPLLHDHGVVSGISVIIQGRGQPFGVLGAHTTQPRKFTADDIHFFQAVANVLAATIERKCADEGLRELSSAVEQTADHVFITDRDGVIQYVNAAFEKSSGYTKEEVLGKTPRIVKSGKHHAEFYENLWQKILAGEVFRAEFINRRKNGELYYEEKTITPIRVAQGNITHFVSTGRDITERKRAEQALRESEERFRTQYESMPMPLFMWRAVNDDFVLLGGNDAAIAFSEAHLHTIVGRKASELYADMPQIREDFARCFATGTVISRELPYPMRSSGEQKELIATYAFIPPDLVTVHVFDVTKRKQAEEALNTANRQLRILSRRRVQVQEDERRHLARELHDQIGQALTATKISIRSAKRSRKREAKARQLDNAIAIVDQMLLQVRQMTLHLRPTALDDLGLVPALRLVLDDYAKRAAWHVQFCGDANLERADAEVETACFRITLEALTNILRHAKARKVSLELRKTGDSLHLIVRDDGIGFDVADAEKRIERDRLGLVGMRERTTVVGGKFECKSVAGQGTEVHAFFPFCSP
jgi:PAS domain S-box-containing protein